MDFIIHQILHAHLALLIVLHVHLHLIVLVHHVYQDHYSHLYMEVALQIAPLGIMLIIINVRHATMNARHVKINSITHVRHVILHYYSLSQVC